MLKTENYTLQETNISPKNGILKMIFLFPRWDMLIPWRVTLLPFFMVPFLMSTCRVADARFLAKFRTETEFGWETY